MEVLETNKIISDVRQSPEWSEYLKSLGWDSYRTTNGISVRIRPTVFGSLVKVQKPSPFDSNDLTEIDKICIEHKAMFIKIEPYLGQDISVLERAGYEVSWYPMTPTATYFIDLQKPLEDLWAAVSHSGKYRINRARREGAYVEFTQNPSREKMSEFYKILKQTGGVKKFYVPPIRQIYTQAEVFGDNGYLAFVFDKDRNVCGAKWCVSKDGMILYISGGTTTLGRDNHAGYELLWQSILHFKSLGFKIFDLEGRNDSRFPGLTARWGGFSHFKEKFGGIPVEFPHPRIKFLSPVFKFLHKYVGFNV